TICTGCRIAPAALKNTADPPGASAVSPNGVYTESSAIEPTTSRLTSHPIRGADPQEVEAVGEHLAHRRRQDKARRLLGLAEHTEDAAHPRVRHLDVEDGVLLGLALREVHVEDQVRVSPAHEKEVAHGVAPHFVDELTHGHVASGTLGDLHLGAALHHGHHLV